MSFWDGPVAYGVLTTVNDSFVDPQAISRIVADSTGSQEPPPDTYVDYTRILFECEQQAAASATASAAAMRTQFFQAFGTELQVLERRVLSSEGYAQALEGWSRCLLNSGFRYRTETEIVEDLEEKLDTLLGLLRPVEEDVVSEVTVEWAEELDRLRAEEVRIFEVAEACGIERDAQVNAIRIEIESSWIQANERGIRDVIESNG